MNFSFLAGCGHSFSIPKPGSRPAKPLPPVEPSTVEVPVTIDLRSTFAEVEKQVPREQRAVKEWTVVDRNFAGDVGIKYEAWREPLRFTIRENRLRVESSVSYWFQAAQRVKKPIVGGDYWQQLASCGRGGEQPRQAVVGLETALGWTTDWQLTSATSVLPTRFANPCQVTFLKIDVTDRVKNAFEGGLKQGATLADTRLRQKGNLRPTAERVWKQLQEPIPLDSSLWLVLDPESAYVAGITGSAESMTATVGFTARPTVRFGPRPAASTHSLPGLATRGGAGGFHVTVEGEITFEEASRQLRQHLVGTKQGTDGNEVEIRDIAVTGTGDGAVLAVTLAGDLNGTIWLTGHPVYDPKSGSLAIPDLDYSIETRDALVKIGDWLNHEGFRRRIAERARWSIAGRIDSAKARLEKGLNRTLAPNIVSSGKVSAIRPLGIYFTPTSIVARVIVDGTLAVRIM